MYIDLTKQYNNMFITLIYKTFNKYFFHYILYNMDYWHTSVHKPQTKAHQATLCRQYNFQFYHKDNKDKNALNRLGELDTQTSVPTTNF